MESLPALRCTSALFMNVLNAVSRTSVALRTVWTRCRLKKVLARKIYSANLALQRGFLIGARQTVPSMVTNSLTGNVCTVAQSLCLCVLVAMKPSANLVITMQRPAISKSKVIVKVVLTARLELESTRKLTWIKVNPSFHSDALFVGQRSFRWWLITLTQALVSL